MLRTLLHSLVLLALVPVLAACEIIISGIDFPYPPGFSLYNASYRSSYQADADGDGDVEFVICDDRTTLLSYHFNYQGSLERWTSFLKSVQSGQIRGEVTFYAGDPRVNYGYSSVDVTYEILAGAAPLAIAPQGITVVPLPTVIGHTRLYLRANGYSGLYALSSQPIPVLANCNG